MDFAGFVARGWLAADRAGGEDDGELLTCFAVAGVEDDVAGVGVDANQAGQLDLDAGLFQSLADRGVG
jgi:hypothetical protein